MNYYGATSQINDNELKYIYTVKKIDILSPGMIHSVYLAVKPQKQLTKLIIFVLLGKCNQRLP